MTHRIVDLFLLDAKKLYGEEWDKIVIDNQLNPSLLSGWMIRVARAFNRLESFRVSIFLDDKDVIGVFPYYIEQKKFLGFGMSCIHLGGNLVSYHQSFIVKKNHIMILDEIIIFWSKKYEWNQLVGAELVDGEKSCIALKTICKNYQYKYSEYMGDSSPYLPLYDSWEEQLKILGRNFRYRVNKRAKQLKKNTNLSTRWFTEENDAEELLKIVFDIEQNSWKVSKNMAITGRPVEKKYYELLIPFMAKSGILIANVLMYKEEAIAYSLCYKNGKQIGQIKTSYKDNYSEYSPGLLVLEEGLKKYIKEGFKEFDFLGNIMRHKRSWTNLNRNHLTLNVFNNTLKSRLYFLLLTIKKKIKKIAIDKIKDK